MSVDAREYLMGVKRTMASLRRREDELVRITSMTHSVTQNVEPRESCRVPLVGDRTSDRIVALMTAKDDYQKALDEALSVRSECLAYLEELEDERYADVLHKRYLMGMGWQDIADDMGYTYHHVHKLHSEAIDRLQEVLDKDKEMDK